MDCGKFVSIDTQVQQRKKLATVAAVTADLKRAAQL
jgi:hypothetical protein